MQRAICCRVAPRCDPSFCPPCAGSIPSAITLYSFLSSLRDAVSALDPLFLDFQSAVMGLYSLDRELGRGGMGIVYLALEVHLDRLVAIKLLPSDKARDPALHERFLRETQTAAM